MMPGSYTNRAHGNRYASGGSGERADLNDKKNTTGSGLPTPEPEKKKLPEDAPPKDNTPNQATSRTGKAPETPEKQVQVPKIKLTEPMMAIGTILSEMNRNVDKLENALGALQKQAGALTALHKPLKLQEELQAVQQELDKQIQRQKEEIKRKREELEGLLIQGLSEQMKQKIDVQIQQIVKEEVVGRIKAELDKQIPPELKRQSMDHRDRMAHVKTTLINNEARRLNANAAKTKLHRLIVPVTMSRSSSGSTAYTPYETPVTPAGSTLFAQDDDSDLCFVSSVFPETPEELYGLYSSNRKKLGQLLADYGEDNHPLDLKDDHQAANSLNRLLHRFGVLGPGHRVIPSPLKTQELILTVD